MKINHKILTLLLIALMPFVLTACSSKQDKDESPETPPTTKSQPEYTNEEEPIPDSENTPLIENENPGVIESIKDALTKDMVIKCRYISDGDEFYMHLKGQRAALESDTEFDGKPVSYKGVIKDNKYYFWQIGKSEGAALDLAKSRENPLEVNDNPVYSFDDVIRELEVSKQECSSVVVPDSMFEVPSDISFTEW